MIFIESSLKVYMGKFFLIVAENLYGWTSAIVSPTKSIVKPTIATSTASVSALITSITILITNEDIQILKTQTNKLGD